MTTTEVATCPRCDTKLRWLDDTIGYRCPRCYLFVALPRGART